jgi:hypothetical protein
LVDEFLYIHALSEHVLIMMGGSIIVEYLLIEYALRVFLLYLIEFLGIFFLLEEKIIVDAFKLVWIEISISFKFVELR